VLLQACLNGGCDREAHPRCPITPSEVAADAIAAVAAGAEEIHVHARDTDGNESLDAEAVAATVAALRETTDAFISLTSGAWISAGVERLEAIDAWRVLPDRVSVNMHEDGAVELAEALLARDVGVEAGVWSPGAAAVLASSGLAERCVRILIEVHDHDTTDEALGAVDAIVAALDGVAPDVPRLLHGAGPVAWDLVAEAARRGYDTRIGLEDTLRLPDGKQAPGNAELVRVALAHYREAEIAV
jgi:uncharacterized protein (DUF849 family)